jgi:hypothetical protein
LKNVSNIIEEMRQILNDCVPMAMYLYKMLNVLQTCPYKFLHLPKLKCIKHVFPMNLDFFGVDLQTPK